MGEVTQSVSKYNVQNLKPFKPGHTGNSAGRAGVLPPAVRAARKQSQVELIKLINHLFTMNDEDMAKAVMAEATTQLERSIMALIGKAKEGDVTAFRFLMEVMVGKIPEHDYDGFTEEDLRILNRVKEVFAEQQRGESEARVVESH